MQTMYEQTMKEWRGCEAIVRQREREKHAEALARCSSGASVERGPVERDSTISTDVSFSSFTCRMVQCCMTEKHLDGNRHDIFFFFVPLQSSLSSNTDPQSVNSQSDSSSSAQVVCSNQSHLLKIYFCVQSCFIGCVCFVGSSIIFRDARRSSLSTV